MGVSWPPEGVLRRTFSAGGAEPVIPIPRHAAWVRVLASYELFAFVASGKRHRLVDQADRVGALQYRPGVSYESGGAVPARCEAPKPRPKKTGENPSSKSP